MQKYFHQLLNTTSWKKPAVIAITCFIIYSLLDSVFFIIIVGLLKLAFFIIGIVALCYALYLAYPLVVKKIQEEQKRKEL